MIKVAAVGIISIVLIAVCRQSRNDYGSFVAMGGILVIAFMCIEFVQEMIGRFNTFAEFIPIKNEYFMLLFKISGTAYISELVSGICKDAGQSALATQIEIAGRLMILAMGMPVVFALLKSIATGFDGVW